MALVAELVTKVTADNSSFIKSMAGVSAAAIATSTATIVAIDRITDKIDNLGKTAQKLGIDFEAFQGLKYAADIANVPIERLQTGMVKLAKNVYDAANGNKEAEASFKRLGLSAGDLQKLSLDKQYAAISDAIGKVSNKNEQLALSMKIFGKSGADQLLLIRDNASALIKEFDDLGLTITEQQRAASESFQDTKKKLETVLSGFADQVAAEAAPAFTILMDEVTKAITGVDDLRGAARSLASSLVSAVQFGVQGFDVFLTVLDSVKDRVDAIITGVGNALQRVGMVHQFLVNGLSGAGFSVDPSLIGRLNPTDTAPASSLGGSVSGAQGRLADLQKQLAEPIYKSFIVPVNAAGTAVAGFATATAKATSELSSMISSSQKGGISDRLSEILGDKTKDSRAVYKDPEFERLVRSIYDMTQSANLNKADVGNIKDLLDRAEGEARTDIGGTFNASPNIGVVADLRKFVDEQLKNKDIKPIQLIIKTTQGFEVQLAESNPMQVAIINGVNKLAAEQARSVGR